MYEQGATTDLPVANPTTTTIKAPTKVSITTALLLKQLAADENANGNVNFPTATPPRGAVLYFNGSGFEIDQGTNQLADVTGDSIMSWSQSGQNDISAGSYSDANGQGSPPYTQTDYYLVTVTYTSPSSNTTNPLNFTVTGLATVTGKATNPNGRTGNYTQSGSISFSDGTGEGSNANGSFVLTGVTMTASGSATENSGTGTNETGD